MKRWIDHLHHGLNLETSAEKAVYFNGNFALPRKSRTSCA
jgi:hypothetical protein